MLETLQELREISLDAVAGIGHDFLSAVRTMPTPIWPKLERGVLGGMRHCGPGGLIHFLRGRYPIVSSCALLDVDTERKYFLARSPLAVETRLILDNERARRNAEK